MVKARIEIIGSLIACSEGVRDDWREISKWLGEKLRAQYGDLVEVAYYDLFDDPKPALPENAKLPIVMVNRKILSQGGKISIPAIKAELMNCGIKQGIE
ncbi:MAG: hypothetical protein GYA34_06260 [Chloroflexi bacterium]|nr:hypothetical protein [Chloroflexota bacterium]